MKKILKWVGIVFLSILTLSVLVAIFSKKPEPTIDPVATAGSASTEDQWKEIYSFSGNGAKKSDNFHLTDGNAKLVYKYKSPTDMGGIFGIYVVSVGHSIEKEGGIPDVMTSETSDTSESSIHEGEGDYYLDVNSQGKWTISVMQQQ